MSTYERIKKGQKKRRNKFIKKISFFFVFIFAAFGVYFLVHQKWFSFGTVYITGNKNIKHSEIMFLAGLEEPVNLLLVDKDRIKNILDNDLRIESVDISYELPAVLHIDVREQKSLVYIMSDYGFVAVSPNKKVVEATKNIKSGSAIIVTGISLGHIFVGDVISNEMVNHIIDFLNDIDEDTKNKTSEINFYGDKEIKIVDLSGNDYFLGSVKDIKSKVNNFSAIIKEVNEKNMEIEFVDLSYSNPYIKIKK